MKKGWIVLLIILGIIIGVVLYARFIGTSGLKIHEIVVENKNIPDSFDNAKIVHFSDLHYGRTVNKKKLDFIKEKINSLNADLILFTGDLIDQTTDISNDDIEIVTNFLLELDAKLGKYAIMGNHDYEDTFFKKIIDDGDFILLNNSYELIYNESYDPIFLGGLSTSTYNQDNIDELFSYEEELPAYKILMLHEGDILNKIDKSTFNLVLGGHSHNGQVRLPFIGALYTPSGAKEYYDTNYKIDDTLVYISNGIGCSQINLRLFNRPSLNLIKLKKI